MVKLKEKLSFEHFVDTMGVSGLILYRLIQIPNLSTVEGIKKNVYLASLKFYFLRMKNYAFLHKSSIYLFGW